MTAPEVPTPLDGEPFLAREERFIADVAAWRRAHYPKVILALVALSDENDETDVYIDTLMIPESQQGRGIGSRIMAEICRRADAEGIVLTSKPTVIGATPLAKLDQFNARFGFRYLATDPFMTRHPRSETSRADAA